MFVLAISLPLVYLLIVASHRDQSLFTLYMLPLASVFNKYKVSFHLHAEMNDISEECHMIFLIMAFV